MIKSDLIEEVSRQQGLTRKEAEIAVNTVFDSIAQALTEGSRVELRGFGSFGCKERNARRGRNPKTGSGVDIPAKRVVFFKTGKALRERVDETDEDGSPSA